MLTELALVFGVELLVLALAGVLTRWMLSLPSGEAESRRLAAATTRAAEAFQWRTNKVVGSMLAGLAALTFAGLAYQAMALNDPAVRPLIAWRTVALLLGGASSCAVAYVAAQLAARGAIRAACATRLSLDHATAVSIRSAGTVGLVADALSVAGPALFVGLIYLGQGGPARTDSELLRLLQGAGRILPFFGVGATAAALALRPAGSAYWASGHVGGALAGEKDAGLDEVDVRNPALVADLVGENVGLAAGRALDGFVAGCLTNVAAIMVGVSALGKMGPGAVLWGAVTLPLVMRALGSVSSAFGVLTARALEHESPARALQRGHATTVVVSLGAQAGACFWLLGDRHWFPFFLASSTAAVLVHSLSHAVRYRMARTGNALRAVSESLRAGPAVATGRAFAGGLTGSWVGILGVTATLTGGWYIGVQADLPSGGGLLALGAALSGTLSGLAYLTALGVLEPLARTAQAVRRVATTQNGEGRKRSDQLDDAGFAAGAVAHLFLTMAGVAGALLAALSLLALPDSPGGSTAVSLGSGLLGALVVLVVTGVALSRAARAARGASVEVERQLRGFPRHAGQAQVPADYTPSYRSVIDQSSRLSLETPLIPVAVPIAASAGLGFSLRLLYSSGSLVLEALASFAVIASVTGLAMALVAEGARVTAEAVHRANRPRGSSTGFDASLTGHALADLLGNAAAPAAHLTAQAVTFGALAVSTLIT